MCILQLHVTYPGVRRAPVLRARRTGPLQILLGGEAIDAVLPAIEAVLNKEGRAERDGCSDNGPDQGEPRHAVTITDGSGRECLRRSPSLDAG